MSKIAISDTFNPTELILDRVRYVCVFDLKDNRLLYRLTSVEDPQLTTTAEGEDVTDALGSVITTIYRSKAATFSGTNSLVHLDLMAAQYGTEKYLNTNDDTTKNKKINVPTFDTYKVENAETLNGTGQWTLSYFAATPPKYIYKLKDNAVSEQFTLGTEASKTSFAYDSTSGKITLPTGSAVGDEFYVEYEYISDGGVYGAPSGQPTSPNDRRAAVIDNIASKFPTQCKLVVYVYFRDKCNDDIIYSGRIISERAKLNPESTELDLTSTGKHPFEFTIQKPYCEDSDDARLFRVIVTP